MFLAFCHQWVPQVTMSTRFPGLVSSRDIVKRSPGGDVIEVFPVPLPKELTPPVWNEAEKRYEISTPAQLEGMRHWINAALSADATYALTADVDLGGIDWTPIGLGAHAIAKGGQPMEGMPFMGTFDGGGHTIRNMTLEDDDYPFEFAGLFGFVSGDRIGNLSLENCIVSVDSKLHTSSVSAGCLVGYDAGGEIRDVKISGRVIAMSGVRYASIQAGGLIGWSSRGRVGDVWISAAVGKSHGDAGCLLGRGYDGLIENVRTRGSVVAYGDYTDAGGLAARYSGGAVRDVEFVGEVRSLGNVATPGGLFGSYAGGRVERARVSADITAVGGSIWAGGMVGSEPYIKSGEILDSFVVGTLRATGEKGERDRDGACIFAGGFYGSQHEGTIRNCGTSVDVVAVARGDASKVFAGGFSGHNNGAIYDSAASGNVSAVVSGDRTHAYAGGFAAVNYGILSGLVARGDTVAKTVGEDTVEVAGGLIADHVPYIVIEDGHAYGNVSGRTRGGLVGWLRSGDISRCDWIQTDKINRGLDRAVGGSDIPYRIEDARSKDTTGKRRTRP